MRIIFRDVLLAGFALLPMLALTVVAEERATELGKLAAQMKPSEWRELPTQGYDKELLTSGGKRIITYSESAGWDPKSRSLHFIGQGHLAPPPKHISYWADTNQWKAEPCPDWLAKLKWFHAYDNNSVDPVKERFFHRPSASRHFWQYDIAEKVWTQLPDMPANAPQGHGTATAFYPELGDAGSLLTFHTGQLHRFDMAEQTWQPISGDFSKANNYHNVAEYNPKDHTVVFGGGNGSSQLYQINRHGKVTTVKPAPCNIGVNASHLMVCPASGDLLVLSYAERQPGFWALDPADSQAEWRKLADAPVGSGAVAPISTYGVVLHLGENKVMVYKHAQP